MALTGDHYVGEFEGHTVELVRNNWVKTLALLIDGDVVDSTTCALPRRITLSAVLECNGVRRTVVAKSVPRQLLWTTNTIEVDGRVLALDKTK